MAPRPLRHYPPSYRLLLFLLLTTAILYASRIAYEAQALATLAEHAWVIALSAVLLVVGLGVVLYLSSRIEATRRWAEVQQFELARLREALRQAEAALGSASLPTAGEAPVSGPEPPLAPPAEEATDPTALFEQAPGIFCYLRAPELTIALANSEALRFLRQPVVIGQPLRALFPNDLYQDLAHAAEVAVTTGEPQILPELLLEQPTGPEDALVQVWYHFTCQPIRSAGGAVLGVLIVGLEVTEQVLARRQVDDHAAEVEALAAALERRLRETPLATPPAQTGSVPAPQTSADLWTGSGIAMQVLDVAHLPVAVLDSEGHIVYLNWACQRLTGYATFEVQGRPFWECFLPPAEVEAFRTALDALVRGGYAVQHENMWLARDGLRRAIAWTGSALRNAGGKVSNVILTGTDITELRQAEAALQESEERFRGVFNSLGEAVFLYELREDNTPGRFLAVSDGASQRFYRRAELLAMLRPDLEAPEPTTCPVDMETLLAQGNLVYRSRRMGKGGEWVPVEVQSRLLPLRGTRAVLAIVRDLAPAPGLQEISAASADLQTTPAQASTTRQPASRVEDLEGRVRRAIAALHWLDADAQDLFERATATAVCLQRMVGDLLAYARVDTHGQPFAPADCNTLLAQALVALRVSIDESGAFVTNGPLPTVSVDAAQLVQLFQSLIANAIRRRGDEPPRIHVAAQRTNAHWTFSLSDNGIAVTSEEEARLHAISKQPESDLADCSGLDLAICRRIVERHGGHIWRETQPGGGVTFYFTLPAENEDDG